MRVGGIVQAVLVASLAGSRAVAANASASGDDADAPAVTVEPAAAGAPVVAAEPAAKSASDEAQWQPPVRFTVGLLAGTGYGWETHGGDIFRDTTFQGGGWAALGHVMPELALLFPRARVLASVSFRYQVITGTTDVYATGFVAHGRRNAFALFQKIGWFPRDARARLQPYLSFATGQGRIARLARRSDLGAICGPARNQECVDIVALGPFFLGAGTGLRARLTDHLDVLLAVDAQVGFDGLLEDRGYNLDVSLGAAAVF